MIAPVRPTPNLPVRRPIQVPAPAPAAKPPVSAGGGDMRVNDNGDLVVKKSVLGLFKVSASLAIEDILAGQYGRDFRLDFPDARHARLTGNAQYGLFAIPVDSSLEIPSGGAVDHMTMHVNDDKTVQIRGELKLFGWKIPVDIKALPSKVGPGVFDFTLNSFQVGAGGLRVPAGLAAWTLSFFANVFSPLKGVKAVEQRLQIDFRKLDESMDREPASQTPVRPPAPQQAPAYPYPEGRYE